MTPAPQNYGVVIATMDRHDALEEVFRSLAAQTLPPHEVVVVDASSDDRTGRLCAAWCERLPLSLILAKQKSAAMQRNQGAKMITSPLICFMDDDVVLPPDTLAKLIEPFSDPSAGGVAGRIVGMEHPVPGRLLRAYYRLQAGYSHRHYGGRLIGAGINLLPAFAAEPDSLVRADWLNSTLVLYRRELFERERFPEFDGYSFMEDVHLSHRIGRSHRLYFRADAPYLHNSRPSSAKSDRRALARMHIRHQRLIARELLGYHGFALAWRLTLHRFFQTFALLRGGGPGIWKGIQGYWIP